MLTEFTDGMRNLSSATAGPSCRIIIVAPDEVKPIKAYFSSGASAPAGAHAGPAGGCGGATGDYCGRVVGAVAGAAGPVEGAEVGAGGRRGSGVWESGAGSYRVASSRHSRMRCR